MAVPVAAWASLAGAGLAGAAGATAALVGPVGEGRDLKRSFILATQPLKASLSAVTLLKSLLDRLPGSAPGETYLWGAALIAAGSPPGLTAAREGSMGATPGHVGGASSRPASGSR